MERIHQVEVVIHVDEALNEESRAQLIENLQRHDGVGKACFTDGRKHLILINYDPDKLQTIDVLGFVKQERVNAELIGI